MSDANDGGRLIPESVEADWRARGLLPDPEQARRDAAFQDLWVALSGIWPPDRLSVGFVFVVFTGIAVYEGLGLLAPVYGFGLTGLFAAVIYVIALNGKARIR